MTRPDPLRRHFEALPEPPLPEPLWARLDRARGRRVQARVAAGGLAVGAIAVLALLPLRAPPPAPAGSTPVVVREAPAPSLETELRVLDRELQDAYNRNSSEAEIARLWQARHALLASRGGSRPARI